MPYALGGALALGVAGVPRGTKDVDVNVFVDESEAPRVMDALAELGIAFQRDACRAQAKDDGMFVGSWDGMRIGTFVPSIPFSHEAAKTVVTVTVDGWSGRFLAPEVHTTSECSRGTTSWRGSRRRRVDATRSASLAGDAREEPRGLPPGVLGGLQVAGVLAGRAR